MREQPKEGKLKTKKNRKEVNNAPMSTSEVGQRKTDPKRKIYPKIHKTNPALTYVSM
jgi:hypothetical protein